VITKPPAKLFSLIKYPAPIGEMSVYLSIPASPPSGKNTPLLFGLAADFPLVE